MTRVATNDLVDAGLVTECLVPGDARKRRYVAIATARGDVDGGDEDDDEHDGGIGLEAAGEQQDLAA